MKIQKNSATLVEIEDISECKAIALNILLVLHDFCKDKGIHYSLGCGSLLGAIRHKGFIPWDDDIDVYLSRCDYNRLVELFPKSYNDVAIVSLERDLKWNRPYAKAYDIRTLCIENATNNVPGVGLGIDVFPLDEVPSEIMAWKRYNRKRMILQRIYGLKAIRISNKRSIIKNSIVLLLKIILFPFSFRFLALEMDRMAQRYDNTGMPFLYETAQGLGGKKGFDKKCFDEVIDVVFEGHIVKVMKGYDEYLTSFYGDYMELPPEDKRVVHHSFKAFWK